ncbi:hypothetical protein JMA_31410 [Jeotgalibacillus malaysiensis]|uniref:Uncharacterized protein n=1 Tax=Jeotgalibacillus malaysiensis TaxID=1508404 RepID=A0A0B5AV32_9BACL|nr:hypothetical protein JMA_31410 [Jeotgalibacillus malaysiensis]
MERKAGTPAAEKGQVRTYGEAGGAHRPAAESVPLKLQSAAFIKGILFRYPK